MFHIHVERLIKKDIDTVFAAIADHANYKQFPGVTDSILTEEGKESKNGLGAQRVIVAGNMRLVERIVGFEPPHFMAYDIEKASPFPMKLERGELKLVSKGDFTRATWTSIGKIAIPVIGPLLDKMFQKKGGQGFGAIFKHIDKAS